jgi:hypothetical protein
LGKSKDANCADALKKPGSIQEPKTLYALALWNKSSPSASSAGYFCTETAVITRLQEMLLNQVDRRLELIKVVKNVLDRPWFNRMWTLQELALGTEILVLCGKASITWHYLALGIQCVLEVLHHETSMTTVEDDLIRGTMNHYMLRWAGKQKRKRSIWLATTD